MAPRSAQLRPPSQDGTAEGAAKPGGRPVRKSAGRKSLPDGFINSADAGIDHSPDSESEHEGAKKTWKQKPISRARPLSPTHFRELPTPSRGSSSEPDQPADEPPATSVPENVSLTFHVPKDHSGPFVVNLNLRDIGVAAASTVNTAIHGTRSRPARPAISAQPEPSAARMNQNYAGFTDLPPEIRNIVYREVFGTGKKLDFHRPEFNLSGQFLRTCKLVNIEAAPLLYGNHSFRLTRDTNTEGAYWKKPWVEVGYRHIRRWLTDVGPSNISHLRELEFSLEDGSPGRFTPKPTAYMSHNEIKEAVRYVYDPDLIECFKLLSRYGALRKLVLENQSRKQLARRDDRFLHELKKIRVDKIEDKYARPANYMYYRHMDKIELSLFKELREKMERETKLYKEDTKDEKKDAKKAQDSSGNSSD